MPGSADPRRKGFQGGTRDLIPNRNVLLAMTRLQTILNFPGLSLPTISMPVTWDTVPAGPASLPSVS